MESKETNGGDIKYKIYVLPIPCFLLYNDISRVQIDLVQILYRWSLNFVVSWTMGGPLSSARRNQFVLMGSGGEALHISVAYRNCQPTDWDCLQWHSSKSWGACMTRLYLHSCIHNCAGWKHIWMNENFNVTPYIATGREKPCKPK